MDALDIFYKLSAGAKFLRNNNKAKSRNKTPTIKKEHVNTLITNSEFEDDVFSETVIDGSDKEVKVKVEEKFNKEEQPRKLQNLELLRGLPAENVIQSKEEKKKKKKNKMNDRDALLKQQNEQLAEIRNKLSISVIGTNAPWPLESFEDLLTRFEVSSVIIKNITKAGYISPTPIQAQAIPTMIEGRQVLCCAPTGSGKTAAFLIPILHSLKRPQKKGFRCVIVCPTRELALQIFRESLRLSEGTGLRIHIIRKVSLAMEKFNPNTARKFGKCGGQKRKGKPRKEYCGQLMKNVGCSSFTSIKMLRIGLIGGFHQANQTTDVHHEYLHNYVPDILITTPNRLVYLLKQEPPTISLRNVEWLVVDESDKLFEAGVRGFRDQLAVIYNACDSSVIKRAMFSATQTPHLTKWCRKNLKNLVLINIGIRNSAVNTVKQELLYVGNESGKLVAFRNLVHKGLTPPVLIFVQSKERAQELFNELVYDGINVDVIHSDRTQAQRENVIRCFREGKIWVLICTELMGRGIDFKGVNLVLNYDFPPSAVSYIHRIGRTGRAGREGRAITYFTQDDTVILRSIARLLQNSGCKVPEYMLTMKKSNKRDKKKLEKKAPMRDSISTTPIYQSEIDRKKRNAINRSKREKRRKLLNGESKE